jgi:O-antigen/teichoic acid export membrane protein
MRATEGGQMRSLPKPVPNGPTLATRSLGRLRALPRTSRNITANFAGTLWTGLMGPALVSVYVRFMGIEAYALVAILTTLQAAFTLLDLGLSTATNRELARLSVREDHSGEARDLVRTTEMVYWLMAVAIGVIVVALAPLLAHRWVHAERLPVGTVQQAFVIMGIILAFQFPFALYSGGLIGLQRQVVLNAITIGAATLRGVGSIALLWLVSPTVQTFFVWQLIATMAQTGVTAWFLWRSLPDAAARPRFRRAIIRRLWRFAAGLMAISFFALLLTQGDKIVLSRLLALEKFGYYTLAAVVASSLYLVVTPIFTAIFPRFTQLVATGDDAALRTLYHQSCQLVSVLLLPVALVIAFFAREILQVWTRNPAVVENAHRIVSLLVIGTALNGLMNVPYALQLANGWTRLALSQNVIAVALLMPLLIWAANRYGGVGAASIWIAVNAGYVVIGIQVMHTRLLRDEKRAWYARDIGLPLTGSLVVVLAGRALFPTDAPALVTLGALALVSAAALAAACILTPLTHDWLRARLLPHRLREELHGD